MVRFATLLVLLLLASGARSQTTGACTLGTAQGDLDVSNVFARVFNTGSLFYGNTTTNGDGYIAPRLSNNSPVFAAGLWLGGIANGELRVAGSRYGNFTFWPGPLNEDGTLPDPDDCSAFDRIYVVSMADVDRYEASGDASAALRDWPVGLGAPGVDASGQPLAVTSRDQTLDLASGERPVLYGSQTAWWVMNDVGGPHSVLGTPPLGVEVRVSAFAIASDEILGAPEATFYRFTVINRNTSAIEDAHIGFFMDPDLGFAGDDLIGVDVERGMMFAYNKSETDAWYGTPPAIAFDLLSGMGTAAHFTNTGAGSPINGPRDAAEYYNSLRGLWPDGTPYRENEFGYGQPGTFPATVHSLSGDPVTGEYWSEENNDGQGTPNSAGNRRFVVSTPMFQLASGESRTVDLGVLFARGTDRLNSITELRAVSDAVQSAYDDGSLFTLGDALATLPAPAPLAPEAGQYLGVVDKVVFSWAPVDGAEGYVLKWGASPEALTSQRGTTQNADSIWVNWLVGFPPRHGYGLQTIYWSVEALADGAVGTPSDARSVQVFVNGPLTLASGEFAYVEVARGDGGDPCGTDAVSPDGCDEVGGNLVWRSFNSTGTYYFSERGLSGSSYTLGSFAPNDFEIRFTEEGGLAAYLFSAPHNVIRVPFEVWDIGPTLPGETNDPSNDVRLIPILYADDVDALPGPDTAGSCAFDPEEIPEGYARISGYVETDQIYAYYPASSYEDFEGDFLAEVDAAPEECLDAGQDEAITTYLNLWRSRPIQRQVFGSDASNPALPATGTIVRLYTADPPPVASAPTPEASGGIALTVGPNPTRGAATVRLTLAAPEAVRVRVLDMLGREVAVLAEGPQASGEAVFTLPGGLASGVYAVEAMAGEQRTTRLITVIR